MLTRQGSAALGNWSWLGPGGCICGQRLRDCAAGEGSQLLWQRFQGGQGLTEGLLRAQALVPLRCYILALRHHVLEQVLPANQK